MSIWAIPNTTVMWYSIVLILESSCFAHTNSIYTINTLKYAHEVELSAVGEMKNINNQKKRSNKIQNHRSSLRTSQTCIKPIGTELNACFEFIPKPEQTVWQDLCLPKKEKKHTKIYAMYTPRKLRTRRRERYDESIVFGSLCYVSKFVSAFLQIYVFRSDMYVRWHLKKIRQGHRARKEMNEGNDVNDFILREEYIVCTFKHI